MEKENNIIMISVCSYCNVIVNAKNVYVGDLSQEDKDKGFQISHGSCKACNKKVIEQIKNGTYE